MELGGQHSSNNLNNKTKLFFYNFSSIDITTRVLFPKKTTIFKINKENHLDTIKYRVFGYKAMLILLSTKIHFFSGALCVSRKNIIINKIIQEFIEHEYWARRREMRIPKSTTKEKSIKMKIIIYVYNKKLIFLHRYLKWLK